MSNALMMTAGSAVLLSYWFLHVGRQLRIPSVVLLLFSGLALRTITHAYAVTVDVPGEWLKVLGTAGLVLIVLEATLDLNLDASHRPLLLRSCGAATFGLLAALLAIAVGFKLWLQLSWYYATLLAMPFAIIGSSIAIPAADGLSARDRMFVVLESSWSDIIGVMCFNALLIASGPYSTTLAISTGVAAALIIGVVTGLGMYWLIGHLVGDVKFLPLLFALMLVYGLANALQFSSLLVVLVLGLILNNPEALRELRWIEGLHSENYKSELLRFKHVTSEATFVVRTFFFLLLGYTTDVHTLFDAQAWMVAAILIAAVLLLRWPILFLLNRKNTRPLLWSIPRGLITMSLFLLVPKHDMAGLPPGTLVLVIFLSCLVMTLGFQVDRNKSI